MLSEDLIALEDGCDVSAGAAQIRRDTKERASHVKRTCTHANGVSDDAEAKSEKGEVG